MKRSLAVSSRMGEWVSGTIGMLLYAVLWLVGIVVFIWGAWFVIGGILAFLTNNQVVFCPPLWSPEWLCTPSG